jgi:hypothetical protein
MIDGTEGLDAATTTTFTLPDGGEARVMVLGGDAPLILSDRLAGNAGTNGTSGGTDDVLRRLMQRREQENNR